MFTEPWIGGNPYYSMTEQTEQKTPLDLEACLEGLLFVAAGPVGINQLAEVLSRKPQEIEDGLRRLELKLEIGRGIQLQRHAGRVQLTTSPDIAQVIEKFLGLEVISHLTRPAIEALAIIAYRQPITRPSIDAIRGVSSDGVIKNLLGKGLVQEIGRLEGPGRPILYGTTADFLQHFGLSSLLALPPYDDVIIKQTENGKGLLKD
jgi:segregation and condensation protein B